MTKRQLDSFIADKISGFLVDANFVEIKDIDYDVPLGNKKLIYAHFEEKKENSVMD